MDNAAQQGFAHTARSYGVRMQECLSVLEPRLRARVMKDIGIVQRWRVVHPFVSGLLCGLVAALVFACVRHAV